MYPFNEELEPVTTAPSLFTFNGFGFKLYRKSDYDAKSYSFMTTHYFVALHLPLFPVARYRVISEDRVHYHFLGKGKFRLVERIHVTLAAALVSFLIVATGLD